MRFDDYMRVGRYKDISVNLIKTYFEKKDLSLLEKKFGISEEDLMENSILDTGCDRGDFDVAQERIRSYLFGIKGLLNKGR